MSAPSLVVVSLQNWPGTLDSFNVHPWYRRLGLDPRSFYTGQQILVREDQMRNLALLAHEIGHAKGHDHPPWYRIDLWLDVMSILPLRWTDQFNLKRAAREAYL